MLLSALRFTTRRLHSHRSLSTVRCDYDAMVEKGIINEDELQVKAIENLSELQRQLQVRHSLSYFASPRLTLFLFPSGP